MSNPPTPLKVSPAATSYTAATMDSDLRSQINTLLINDELSVKIQEALLHSLNAHPANWPTQIQQHALSLLRTGDITTFPALLDKVLEDVRQSTAAAAAANSSSGTNGEANGKKTNGDAGAESTSNLAVPQAVVDEALKVTMDCLVDLVEFSEENGTT
ncbi:hypothetical protein MCOR25_001671 [Pyricularia grisea]|uniref:Uncharacterized protein n=1 Tax=Pyricularia grisea TaxID=148305 RepID=A0A6P8ATS9_PYRGI|nr:uncharacterized protein PgNI_09559 [Pyricularia grisea]KAI6380241.1 hypothetical protein MCOR25_001671 [Pyricularia grisea]TLD05536.1 hypothetical protein PgNI_09559 [Pyricularia grisea]